MVDAEAGAEISQTVRDSRSLKDIRATIRAMGRDIQSTIKPLAQGPSLITSSSESVQHSIAFLAGTRAPGTMMSARRS